MSRTLGDSINAATRPVHTKLNKLIISRLPLALPPHAKDPYQYVSGLLHIASIYTCFEAVWREFIDSPEARDGKETIHEPHKHSVAAGDSDHDRLRSILTGLHFEDLQRSQTLRKDLTSLTHWSLPTLKDQLARTAESPVLEKFLGHIISSTQKSPHILIAYGWVLYMALFAGGRFIRAALEDTSPDFWKTRFSHRTAHHVLPLCPLGPDSCTAPRPFSFYHFNAKTANGDDLKQAFKKRLLESESLLTDSERSDIVREAINIFDFMLQIVSELDDVCDTDVGIANSRSLSMRSRDSIDVERERRQHLFEAGKRAGGKSSSDGNVRELGEGHVKFG
ncbi:heme oxygenase-like protein [Xylariaceae sp. FL1019]|nr:heme oxygenase-like protein [Xylariaceae sp. FL1019]